MEYCVPSRGGSIGVPGRVFSGLGPLSLADVS
jgi:hypothetical protein